MKQANTVYPSGESSRLAGQVSSTGLCTDPYWWEQAPLASKTTDDFPEQCDVAIIGAGYTGLCAALELSRSGRRCVVLDKSTPGAGCSSRNGGQIGTSVGPGYNTLAKKHGAKLAGEITKTGFDALQWLKQFIADQQIECNFEQCGRFYGAHTAERFTQLPKRFTNLPTDLTLNAEVIPRSEQHKYIDSNYYHGGLFYPDHCSLHPSKYHQQLLSRVEASHCQVIGNCAVTQIKEPGHNNRSATYKFELNTARGNLRANHIIIATNGYSDNIFPWIRRRIIPIGSYMLATEALPTEQISRLMPQQRVFTDTRKMVVYYRPCPDQQRIIFGARVSLTETNPLNAVDKLHKQLCQRFPECESVGVTHSWMGFVAYTFDAMPHLGEHDGIHYAAGYCGSGIAMASYCGTQVAKQLMADAAPHALAKPKFSARFYYRQKPWFLAPSLAWYRMRDSMRS